MASLDGGDAGSVARRVATLAATPRSSDVLAYNVGFLSIDTNEDETIANGKAIMNTNVFSPARCMTAVVSVMRGATTI